MNIQGTIKQIGEIQTFDSGFKKCEFILTTDEQYPQDIKFEALKEKADNFSKYNKVGDKVDVSFNLRGSEYQGKYYVNLISWRVEKVNEEVKIEDTDDLPFDL